MERKKDIFSNRIKKNSYKINFTKEMTNLCKFNYFFIRGENKIFFLFMRNWKQKKKNNLKRMLECNKRNEMEMFPVKNSYNAFDWQ